MLPKPTEPATVQHVKLRLHDAYDLTIGDERIGPVWLGSAELTMVRPLASDEAQLEFERAAEDSASVSVTLPGKFQWFALEVEHGHAAIRLGRVWVMDCTEVRNFTFPDQVEVALGYEGG